jgi:transposase
MTWRNRLPADPACDGFRAPTPAERAALKADIEQHGIRVPILMWRRRNGSGFHDVLLDGKTRLDIAEELGWDIFKVGGGYAVPATFITDENLDAWAVVASANVHRRHLLDEDKAEIVRQLRARNYSTRAIAEQTGISQTTVVRLARAGEPGGSGGLTPEQRAKLAAAAARPSCQMMREADQLEGAARDAAMKAAVRQSEIEKQEYLATEAAARQSVVGRDGKSYPATKPTKPKRAPKPPTEDYLPRLVESDPFGAIDSFAAVLDGCAKVRALPQAERLALARSILTALNIEPGDLK